MAPASAPLKFACIAFLLGAFTLQAHVGSPDVFFEGNAGPYPVAIAIRPPNVIPGIAEVEIRTPMEGIASIHVVPFPLVGVGSKYPPTADTAKRSNVDPHLYTSAVWLMAFGSYQVRVEIDGVQGHGAISVPIPSIAREIKQMNPGLGWILALLMLLIFAGAVSIAGAAARESTLPEGESPNSARRRRSRLVMAATAFGIFAVLALGNWWWGVEASNYRAHIYKPLTMGAEIEKGLLHLRLTETKWALRANLNDFLPDHGHLMHLFVVRMPELDRIWHLHPDFVGSGEFVQAPPSLPAGRYKLFADVVHASGFPETPVADLEVPTDLHGMPLAGDDAEGISPPLSAFAPQRAVSPLRDGYKMVRLNAAGPLLAKQMQHLAFEVQDSSGHPVTDLEPYMGMAGHAEFLLADASVFAHVHPSGTVPMAALGLTTESKSMESKGIAAHHQSMPHMQGNSLPAQLSFPFGFPKGGRYRMFIQIQRAGLPETACFDFDVRDRLQ